MENSKFWLEVCNKLFCLSFVVVILNRLANSQRASVMTGGGFFRSTKFRYSGRTEREILTESLNALRQQLNNTSPSKRKANSVPATPSSPQGELSELRMMNRKFNLNFVEY